MFDLTKVLSVTSSTRYTSKVLTSKKRIVEVVELFKKHSAQVKTDSTTSTLYLPINIQTRCYTIRWQS